MKYVFWMLFTLQSSIALTLFGQNQNSNLIIPCSPPKSAECQSRQQERDAINSKKKNTKSFGD
jgi:hypothetical protein